MTVIPEIRIQAEDFNLESEVSKLTKNSNDIGAVVTFSGLCRDEKGTLAALELEHYPGMAEAEIRKIAKEAIDRFNLTGMTAIHRYGKILPGENIVLVIAASPHRHAAFDGANFLMDFLKTNAPFWKKEHLKNGKEGKWVDARDSDVKAASRWEETPSRP